MYVTTWSRHQSCFGDALTQHSCQLRSFSVALGQDNNMGTASEYGTVQAAAWVVREEIDTLTTVTLSQGRCVPYGTDEQPAQRYTALQQSGFLINLKRRGVLATQRHLIGEQQPRTAMA
jgi:hypothetical protein